MVWHGLVYRAAWPDEDTSHSGIVPDFSAFMALLPEQKKGVVLLFNADHFTMQLTLTEVARLWPRCSPESSPLRSDSVLSTGSARPAADPLLQIVGVVVTLGLIQRWRRDPQRRPKRGRMWGQHILLPLIPNLLLPSP